MTSVAASILTEDTRKRLTNEQLSEIAKRWSAYRGAVFYPFDVEKMLALAGELAGVE